MYCVKCEAEYHTGLTCDAYQILLKWKEEEAPTMYNIGIVYVFCLIILV